MVWAGIWEQEIVDPYFFNVSNVTGEIYLEFLQTFLLDYLQNVSLLRQQNFFFLARWSTTSFCYLCVLLPKPDFSGKMDWAKRSRGVATSITRSITS